MKMSKHLIWFAFLAIIFLGGCMDTSIPEGNPPTVNVPAGVIEESVMEDIIAEDMAGDFSLDLVDDMIGDPVLEDEDGLVEVEKIINYDYEIENLELEVDGLLDEFNESLGNLE